MKAIPIPEIYKVSNMGLLLRFDLLHHSTEAPKGLRQLLLKHQFKLQAKELCGKVCETAE